MPRKEQLGLLKKVCLGSFPRVYPIVLVRYFFYRCHCALSTVKDNIQIFKLARLLKQCTVLHAFLLSKHQN